MVGVLVYFRDMAKLQPGLVRISSTIGNMTFVQTKKGTYIRAPRGSKKAATCNDSLTRSYQRNHIVNPVVQLVHDVVKAYAPSFKKSDLWHDMNSRVRKCASDVFIDLLQQLEGVEVNPVYALGRISPAAMVEVQHGGGAITLRVHNRFVAFDAALHADRMYCELPVIFADDEGKLIEVTMVHTGWMPLQQDMGVYETSFELPVTAKYCVVLMKIQAGKNGKEIEDKRAMGLKVMKVVDL